MGEAMTKATRSLIASEIGIERARKALIDLGINQTGLEKRTRLSRSTIGNFFKRIQIDHTNFTEICKTLNLEWEEIVEKDNPMKLDNCQIKNIPEVETNSPRLAAFVIEGSFPIDALTQAKIQALVKQLQKITGDASLEIVDIQQGSIKIILKGTPEALATIQDLYNSGRLSEVEGISVKSVKLILNEKQNKIVNEPTNTSWLYKLSPKLYKAYRKLFLTINKAKLSGAYLRGVCLSKANLSKANLSKANLSKANLRESNLIGADLRGADLRGSDLCGADLRGADLRGADLRGANLRESSLSVAYLSGSSYLRADLRGADLRGANLREAYLSEANLSEANLSRADLSGANLSEVHLIGTNLIGANLIGANLIGANLIGADLSYTNVESARFANNLGISEDLKLDLINRGAIFDDSRGDRSGVLIPV